MKKKIAAVLVALCLAAAFLPTVSRAAIAPYFMAVNDTLMPFRTETMPYISGGEIFVPEKVLEGLGVFATGSDDLEFLRLYNYSQGVALYVDFYTASGDTKDRDGNTLYWPPARRIGRRFYVPLRQICDYFGLVYEFLDVPLEYIDNEQMYVVRIISSANFNGPTFLGLNRNALRAAYNEYYTPVIQPPQPSPPAGATPTPTPPPEPPPDYSSITVYLSFCDVADGGVGGILDLLDIQVASGYQSCFFVSAGDIRENPGLIRRISGSGHMIGIMLTGGSFAEYLEASALLFEATKIKTVLVSADESVITDIFMPHDNGLILWESSLSLVDCGNQSTSDITATISQESGARINLLFPCSEDAALVLPGVISYLRENEYSMGRITETVAPVHPGAASRVLRMRRELFSPLKSALHK